MPPYTTRGGITSLEILSVVIGMQVNLHRGTNFIDIVTTLNITPKVRFFAPTILL